MQKFGEITFCIFHALSEVMGIFLVLCDIINEYFVRIENSSGVV
jgi:hypothetical protein